MQWKCLIGLLLCCFQLTAQNTLIEKIINAPVVKQPVYTIQPQPGVTTVQLHCDYAGYPILNPEAAIAMNGMQVLAVDLVFTDYPSHLSLKELNTLRLHSFVTQLPQLKNNADIDWQLIRQTDGATKAAAQAMFHGFTVYCRPLQTKEAMFVDSTKLADMLTRKPTVRIKHNGFLATDTTRLREMYEIEPYTIVKKMPVLEALRYLGMDEKLKTKYPNIDSILVFERPMNDSTETVLQYSLPEDSTVIKVLDRMPWQQMLVVTDVTASMYPYSGQLLLWLRLNEDERRIHQFVFFNDGDNKEEADKQPGRTGGIYTTASSVFEEAEKLLYKTMSRGTGGAIPENNIEALLYGIAACPTCKEVVMIADNWAGVSDLSLLPMLNRPIRIIVCGVRNKINPVFLDIARQTKGSVHIAEADLQNLATLKEGETIVVLGVTYKMEKGRFVERR